MKVLTTILSAALIIGTAFAAQSQDCDVTLMQVKPHAQDTTITLALLGDVELVNAASELNATNVEASRNVRILSGPGSHFSEIDTIPAGQVVEVNACSSSQNWLRTVTEDGQVGWISSLDVNLIDNSKALPVANVDTPVYATMQAFSLRQGSGVGGCASAQEMGVLIQVPANAEPVPMQINGVAMLVNGTIFVQAEAGGAQTIETLAGEAVITVTPLEAVLSAGMRAVVPLSSDYQIAGAMHIEPYTLADVETLPVDQLPEMVALSDPLADTAPRIVGLEPCRVLSDSGETTCALHFVNRDGDAITQMDVQFVSAPEGEWTGSTRDDVQIVQGDAVSGAVGWSVNCSLGQVCFIGPVIWSITLTDAAGNVSEPFEASFNCVVS
ncbi:MAG: SH3 domain-containing protein [Chloroflexi bacterium]|nr:SH3 domain-containing protein [Chloroflexota bacterium]